MKTNAIISLFLFSELLLASCSSHVQNFPTSETLRTIEFPSFKIRLTGNWEKFYSERGDSCLGITNSIDSLYLSFCSSFAITDTNSVETYLSKRLELDGFDASIRMPRQNQKGDIYLHLKNVDSKSDFIAFGKNIKDVKKVLEIFRSFQFENGTYDPDVEISQFSFSSYSTEKGRQYFQEKCAACHNPMKDATGPSIVSIIQIRNKDWVYDFLTSKTLRRDKISKGLIGKYGGIKCSNISGLDNKQTKVLVDYIFSHTEPIAVP